MRFPVVCLSFALFATAATADISDDIEAIFSRDLTRIDLAEVKIEVDRMIDPSIDRQEQLAEIDLMVTIIQAMLPPNADAWDRVETIRQFIYEPGVWNDNHPFSYDHDDPYGLQVQNRLLADYIQDRRGNCITMPFLFIILGQRLGLDVTPAMAPLHVFVRFTDDEGVVHNLEATSGAGRARDSHYRRLLPITDAAISNGVFLTSLTREESVAVIASVVVDDLIARGEYEEAIEVADVLLNHYPNFVYLMVKRGTAAYYLMAEEYHSRYPTYADVPAEERPYLAYLANMNQESFDTAERLGWRPVEQ